MTSPGRPRSAARWIVIGVVAALAAAVTFLVIGLLNKPLTGTGPTASTSVAESATSKPSARPAGSATTSSTPRGQAGGRWTVAAAMTEARSGATAIRLLDGMVLVAGGSGAAGDLASAELYDPRTGSWTATGKMLEVSEANTATLLPDGRVLVAGGVSYEHEPHALASAELYDPASGTWAATGSMINARFGHTATLLPDGQVLVAGGTGASASAELYDPDTGAWAATGNMVEGHQGHMATLLLDGTVLVIGGESLVTEIYDPRLKTWTAVGNMTEARSGFTATTLPDGRVLVAGGYGAGYLSSAELYDPATDNWTPTGGMIQPRVGPTATLLLDGTLLVAGGGIEVSVSGDALASAEIYDPSSETWAATASMGLARHSHTATLLLDGRVLVVGGGSAPASAELYDPPGVP